MTIISATMAGIYGFFDDRENVLGVNLNLAVLKDSHGALRCKGNELYS